MTVGQRIKAIRLKKGLTQQEIGERIGTTASYVGQYENGARLPKLETIQKFANALDVNIAELLRPAFENDEDFVYMPWFEELSDEDLVSVFLNGANLSGEANGSKVKASKGSTKRSRAEDLLAVFNVLNDAGKEKAIERVEELAEIPRYQAKRAAEATDTPSEEKGASEE